MNDIFLVNYSHINSQPLRSISQLSERDAYEMASRIYKESPCRAHNRFGPDFQWYYSQRMRVEKWLYQKFIVLGGKPQTEHPLYFALHHCDHFDRNFNYGKQTRILLRDVDENDVSFTFGDSMAMMDSPDRKDPITKRELLEHIALCDNNIFKFLDSIKMKYVCIEAQLWSERYFALNRTG